MLKKIPRVWSRQQVQSRQPKFWETSEKLIANVCRPATSEAQKHKNNKRRMLHERKFHVSYASAPICAALVSGWFFWVCVAPGPMCLERSRRARRLQLVSLWKDALTNSRQKVYNAPRTNEIFRPRSQRASDTLTNYTSAGPMQQKFSTALFVSIFFTLERESLRWSPATQRGVASASYRRGTPRTENDCALSLTQTLNWTLQESQDCWVFSPY